MTSTDSSNSQNQNNSTSETLVDTSNSKAMNTTTNNESQAAANESQHEVSNTADISNMSSSEASSSPSSSSPASSSPATSSNNTSTDKVPTKTTTEDNNNKPSESEQPANTNNNTNKPSQKSNHSKKNHTNQKHNSIDHSPIVVPPSQLAHQPFVNYYPYVPRGSAPNSLPPYTQQFDASASQQGPWLSHAMAAMSSDPMAMAAYMSNGQQPQNGAPYPTDQQHYEQFNFGFTPAFGFGYAGTGSIDYMSIQQAAQQGSNLNPQSTQWTPNSATATGASTTTTTTTTNTTTATNPTSSPANTTTSSNDTTSSVPSTSASETSASNVKWMQVTQDPSSVLEFNAFPQQQLSPVDMYTPQAPHHNNSNSYRSYNRHQMQPNYHHYQYQNPYQHYPGQYNMHPMHTNNHGNHHYNSHKYNKYNNYYNDNNTGFNYQTHDNNNNSKKSNNLNNTDATVTVNGKQAVAEASETTTGGTETKSESGSKSWASIVGVSGSTSNTSTSTQQTSTGSSPAPVETTQIQQQPQYQYQNKKYTQSYQQYNNFYGEYIAGNNMRPRNNYQKGHHNKHQSNLDQQQQAFDLTNRSFPPINATVTKDELNEIKKSSVKKDPATYETSTGYNPSMAQQHQYSQNSKKQQQYNNYQRQQQQEFNLPFGKYHQNYQNGATVNYVFNNGNPKYTNNNESSSQVTTAPHHRAEKPYKGESSYFNKRHQPSQRTLSSFLNVNDKTKLDDSKFSSNGTSKQTTATSVPKSETSIEQLSQQTDQLQIVDPSMQQQHQQLTVYMNPSAYNPIEFNTSPKAARFFVIKSYSEDDIHRSIKYNIWCSTEHGNRRLDSAYFKGDGQVPVYLFFSVNGSGHFCGMAEMESRVDYNRKTGVWTQEKWRGCFHVKWIYVKDVPNSLLRNIKLENNDNKPVTNSRDTQEIPYDKGIQVLKVFHTYNHSSSILDDFEHYERKQEEDKSMQPLVAVNPEGLVNKTNQVEEIKPAADESNDKETAERKKPEQAVDSSVSNSTTKITTSNISVTSSPSSSSSTSTASSTSSIDESKEPSQEAANKAPQQTTTAATEVVDSST